MLRTYFSIQPKSRASQIWGGKSSNYQDLVPVYSFINHHISSVKAFPYRITLQLKFSSFFQDSINISILFPTVFCDLSYTLNI